MVYKVKNGDMDVRTISGAVVQSPDSGLWLYFCLNKKDDKSANVVAYDEKSGRVMEMFTDLPGVQLYCGNFLDGIDGKEGTKMNQHAGFCLETQVYPDSPNQKGFPNCIYDAGEEYKTKTVYKFSVKE